MLTHAPTEFFSFFMCINNENMYLTPTLTLMEYSLNLIWTNTEAQVFYNGNVRQNDAHTCAYILLYLS